MIRRVHFIQKKGNTNIETVWWICSVCCGSVVTEKQQRRIIPSFSIMSAFPRVWCYLSHFVFGLQCILYVNWSCLIGERFVFCLKKEMIKFALYNTHEVMMEFPLFIFYCRILECIVNGPLHRNPAWVFTSFYLHRNLRIYDCWVYLISKAIAV